MLPGHGLHRQMGQLFVILSHSMMYSCTGQDLAKLAEVTDTLIILPVQLELDTCSHGHLCRHTTIQGLLLHQLLHALTSDKLRPLRAQQVVVRIGMEQVAAHCSCAAQALPGHPLAAVDPGQHILPRVVGVQYQEGALARAGIKMDAQQRVCQHATTNHNRRALHMAASSKGLACGHC